MMGDPSVSEVSIWDRGSANEMAPPILQDSTIMEGIVSRHCWPRKIFDEPATNDTHMDPRSIAPRIKARWLPRRR